MCVEEEIFAGWGRVIQGVCSRANCKVDWWSFDLRKSVGGHAGQKHHTAQGTLALLVYGLLLCTKTQSVKVNACRSVFTSAGLVSSTASAP